METWMGNTFDEMSALRIICIYKILRALIKLSENFQ
jgi:hypothetical protein